MYEWLVVREETSDSTQFECAVIVSSIWEKLTNLSTKDAALLNLSTNDKSGVVVDSEATNRRGHYNLVLFVFV